MYKLKTINDLSINIPKIKVYINQFPDWLNNRSHLEELLNIINTSDYIIDNTYNFIQLYNIDKEVFFIFIDNSRKEKIKLL